MNCGREEVGREREESLRPQKKEKIKKERKVQQFYIRYIHVIAQQSESLNMCGHTGCAHEFIFSASYIQVYLHIYIYKFYLFFFAIFSPRRQFPCMLRSKWPPHHPPPPSQPPPTVKIYIFTFFLQRIHIVEAGLRPQNHIQLAESIYECELCIIHSMPPHWWPGSVTYRLCSSDVSCTRPHRVGAPIRPWYGIEATMYRYCHILTPITIYLYIHWYVSSLIVDLLLKSTISTNPISPTFYDVYSFSLCTHYFTMCIVFLLSYCGWRNTFTSWS